MTTNIDRATEVIGAWIDDNLPHDEANFGADEGIAQALADAGRLTRDLPEANDPTASFVPDGKGWLLDGPTGPVVWTAPGGLVMVQRIEPGDLTPADARDLANILNAAADHAEGVGRA